MFAPSSCVETGLTYPRLSFGQDMTLASLALAPFSIRRDCLTSVIVFLTPRT